MASALLYILQKERCWKKDSLWLCWYDLSCEYINNVIKKGEDLTERLKNCEKKKSGILILFVAGFCIVFQRETVIQFIENTQQIPEQKIKVARYEES